MADIFISYSRDDLPQARAVAAALEAQGWSVWWDRTIPAGRDFDDVIEEALDACKCVVVLWSKKSVKSRWVRTEAREGLERSVLVPVMIEEARLPLAFRRIHAADLVDWDSSGDAPRFRRLVDDIAAVLGASPKPGRPTPRVETAVPRAGDTWTDPVLGQTFVYVPHGSFWMGSPASEAGRFEKEVQHRVELTRGFWIAATPVTRGHFAAFVAATRYPTEAEREGWSWQWGKSSRRWWEAVDWEERWEKKKGVTWRDSGGNAQPVVHVSWNDADAFCRWLSEEVEEAIRLPTEAEWEYAARAGTDSATFAGDLTISDDGAAPELHKIAWYRGTSGGGSQPVRRKHPNAWGLYDMLGNVWEWVQDAADWDAKKNVVVTDTYAGNEIDPLGQRGSYRVVRGGSWFNEARRCRSADRGRGAPSDRRANVGFRLVRT